MIEALRDRTYMVRHSPNCPKRFEVRLTGSGLLGFTRGDHVGFGDTADEAAANALISASGVVAAMQESAAALRLAAKPADEGVRELKQRIHNLRVTLSSVVTLAESGPVNLKTQNAIAKAAKHSLDRDASLSTTGEPKR